MCLRVRTHSYVCVLVCITYTRWCQKRNLIASLHLNTCVHWISCSFRLAGLLASRKPPVSTSHLITEPWITANHHPMTPYRDPGLQHTTMPHTPTETLDYNTPPCHIPLQRPWIQHTTVSHPPRETSDTAHHCATSLYRDPGYSIPPCHVPL